MGLPQYVKDAQNNYNASKDIIQLKFPQGTKDRIRAIIGKNASMVDYCRQAVLTAIESDEDERKAAPDTVTTPRNAPERTKTTTADKIPTDTQKEANQATGNAESANNGISPHKAPEPNLKGMITPERLELLQERHGQEGKLSKDGTMWFFTDGSGSTCAEYAEDMPDDYLPF